MLVNTVRCVSIGASLPFSARLVPEMAMMGEKAAMACTAAVEEVIDEHYAKQAAALGDDEAELRATIEQFRADELEHRDTALEHDAEQTPGYEVLSAVIKRGSRLAIWLSERI
jgi:ubiquinone biosynthesis monooxygenase Coq7